MKKKFFWQNTKSWFAYFLFLPLPVLPVQLKILHLRYTLRTSSDTIDCCPKFATVLNIRIGICSSKSIRVTKLCFCLSDYHISWVNHFGKRTAFSLIYFLIYAYLNILAQSQVLSNSLYQNFEQLQSLQNFYFQSHLSVSKINQIFLIFFPWWIFD